jgi:outer membrane immunogenic protein
MKTIILATAALASFATLASAADMQAPSVPAAPPLVAAPVFHWGGFYLGAHAGYGWSDAEAELASVDGLILSTDVENGVFPTSIDVEHDALFGGVQAGYNLQAGMFMVGVEADASWMDADGTARLERIDPEATYFGFPNPFFGAPVTSTFGSELDWLATLRARAGVAAGRALLYATGGFALGEVTNSFHVSIPPGASQPGYSHPAWSSSETEWGWTIGAGIEYALTEKLSVKFEYLHYDLEDGSVRATDSVADPIAFIGEHIEYDFANSGNLVRAGLNFRF